MVNSIYLFDAAGINMDGPGVGHLPRATVYVDISDVVEAKKRALLALGLRWATPLESVDASLAQAKGRDQLTGVDLCRGVLRIAYAGRGLRGASHEGALGEHQPNAPIGPG